MLAIQQAQGIGGVAGREDDLKSPAAEGNVLTVLHPPRNMEGPSRIAPGLHSCGQSSADALGSESVARISVRPALFAGAGEGSVLSQNVGKFGVAAGVVEVGVGVEHGDRQFRQARDHVVDFSDPHSRVKQQCPLAAEDQVGDDLFKLVGLVDGVNAVADAVYLEPVVVYVNPLQRLVFGAWEFTAPFRAQRLAGGGLRRGQGAKPKQWKKYGKD